MSDLYTALEAAIRARLDVARAIVVDIGLSPWHVEYHGDKGYPQSINNDRTTLIADCYEGVQPAPIAEYIALHDPADAIRRYERDLKVLARHKPCSDCGGVGWAHRAGCHTCCQLSPCTPLRDLLDVYPEVKRDA